MKTKVNETTGVTEGFYKVRLFQSMNQRNKTLTVRATTQPS